jgi:hypothetical protein
MIARVESYAWGYIWLVSTFPKMFKMQTILRMK